MGTASITEILSRAGLKPTPNRVLVLRALSESRSAQSLMQLEHTLETLDKSSISRVLQLLSANKLIHCIEDGRGILRYELCRGNKHCSVDDMHAHFYCTNCGELFCLTDIQAPVIDVPDEFRVDSISYMLKGICPDCMKQMQDK